MMNQVFNNNSRMDEVTPLKFYLSQNYPNPFSEKTTIKYCVAYKTKVRLTVFDEDGNEIEKLVDEEQKAGTYEVVFKSAARLPDGQVGSLQSTRAEYIYRLEATPIGGQAGGFLSEKKMILENESSHTH